MVFPRFSIRIKLIAIVLILLGVGIGILTYTFVKGYSELLRNNLESDVSEFASLATTPIGSAYEIYRDAGFAKLKQQIERVVNLQSSISNVSVADVNGVINFQLVEDSTINVSLQSARSLERSTQIGSSGFIEYVIQPYVDSDGFHEHNIIYSINSESIEKEVSQTTVRIFLYSSVQVIIVVAALYLALYHLLVKPVRSLRNSSVKITQGDYNQSLEIYRKDEIGELSKSISAMAAKLKQDIDTLQKLDDLKSEFIAIISHNLRTPLTIVEGEVDNAIIINDPNKTKEILESAQIGIRQLKNITESALTISKLELGSEKLYLEKLEIGPILTKLAEDFSQVASKKSKKFSYTIIDGHVALMINKSMINNAIWGLLDNALKFTEENGEIMLSAAVSDKNFVINIEDNGAGINPDDIPMLFTKYHRAEDVYRETHEGQGLGLYVAKMIFEKHSGVINLRSEKGQGTTVTMTLPINASLDDNAN